MTRRVDPAEPVQPARPLSDRRRDERRGLGRRETETLGTPGTALAPIGPVETHAHIPPAIDTAAFSAQVLGQSGQKKGLKGGPPVLDAARGAYLGAQWAGPGDRRPKPGQGKKTEV